MSNIKRRVRLYKEITNPDNWKPNVSAIANNVVMSRSAVSHQVKTLIENDLIKVTIELFPNENE